MKIFSYSRRTDLAVDLPKFQAIYDRNDGPDCFWVIWTKNPACLLNAKVDFGRMACQFTITGMGNTWMEPGVPTWEEAFDAIRELPINPALINWRMDPLLPYYHDAPLVRAMAEQAQAIGINRCMTSFISWYGKVVNRWPASAKKPVLDIDGQRAMLTKVRDILAEYNIQLYSCASPQLAGIVPSSSCIDGRYYQSITGFDFLSGKDATQRKACGCTVSKDLGDYWPCKHGCVYCYARPDICG